MPNLHATVQSIPRTIVRNSFDAARLPLTVAETLLRRGDKTAEWPPTLAFESVEASVKEAVGSFLRDDELTREGRLAQAKIAQLRKAAHLEAVADEVKSAAEADYRDRVTADARRRQQVEAQTDARQSALEDEKARKQRDADARAEEQRAAATKAEAAERKAVARREREERAAKVAAAQAALDQQSEAMKAADAVENIDLALQTTKAVRKRR